MPTSARRRNGPFSRARPPSHTKMNTESLALDFKSATLYAIRVVLHSADPERLSAALAKRMADAGSFFENEPVVVDASRVEETIDWPALIAELRGHNLPPIGVVAEGANLEAARKAGLTPVELSTPAPRPAQAVDMAPANDVSTPVPSIQAAAVTTAPAPSDIAEPASSGKAAPRPTPCRNARPPAPPRRLPRPPSRRTPRRRWSSLSRCARASASMRATPTWWSSAWSARAPRSSPTATCMYGPLRGKAMAGARGDATARIFTTHLDAELLAVAGVYRVVEDKLDRSLHNQPALVRLDGDTLRIEALKA